MNNPQAVRVNGLKARDARDAVPLFDGKNLNIHEYVNQIKIIANELRAGEERSFIILLSSRLTGHALEHFQRNLSTYTDIATLINDFRTRFTDEISTVSLINSISREHMLATDDIESYGSRVENKLHCALASVTNNSTLTNEAKDAQKDLIKETALKQFLRGLKPELEVRVRMQVPRTLTDAIIQAKLINKEYNECLTYHTTSSENNLTPQTNSFPTKTELCLIHGICEHDTNQCHIAISKLNRSPQNNNFNNSQQYPQHNNFSNNRQQPRFNNNRYQSQFNNNNFQQFRYNNNNNNFQQQPRYNNNRNNFSQPQQFNNTRYYNPQQSNNYNQQTNYTQTHYNNNPNIQFRPQNQQDFSNNRFTNIQPQFYTQPNDSQNPNPNRQQTQTIQPQVYLSTVQDIQNYEETITQGNPLNY